MNSPRLLDDVAIGIRDGLDVSLTHRGEVAVSLPIFHRDGDSLFTYVDRHGAGYRAHDGGSTIGLRVSDDAIARKMNRIEQVAQSHDCVIEDGEIVSYCEERRYLLRAVLSVQMASLAIDNEFAG